MVEDLSGYLQSHNIKACYLYSGIRTIEGVEMICNLRLGLFDVLVGINLLRKGFDIPAEVL